MQPIVILQLLVLLALANGTPVIAKRLLGRRLSWPLDGGYRFFDGRPLFGPSKTARGIALSLVVTTALAPLVGLEVAIGATVAATAMLGDLFSSFIKRRFKMPASSKATGLDQIPESLFPMLACQQALDLSITEIVAVVVIFFLSGLVLSPLFYKLNVRKHPY